MPYPRFVGQPFRDADQVGEILSRALDDQEFDRAWFVTAWAKKSGLSRLTDDLEAFRRRGGRIEGIVGVDEGGATVEGLDLATKNFDEAFVFHDPGQRTFHPKIYVVQSDERATAVVGSSNMTKGGLFTNFEGSIAVELDLEVEEEAVFLRSVRAYFDELVALADFCRPLDNQLIEDLIEDPNVVVQTEKQANRSRRKSRRHDREASRVFGGGAIRGLRDAPSAVDLPEDDKEDEDRLLSPVADGVDAGEAEESDGESGGVNPSRLATVRPEITWWKRLTMSDAHRKPASSHQRNQIVLGTAGKNIDRETWFREELFGDLPWEEEPVQGSDRLKEVTYVPFEVFVEDEHLGQFRIEVDHDEHRIHNQNNAPTYLNWSSMLPVIKSNDFEDWWLELARLTDGTYRMRLSREEPGY